MIVVPVVHQLAAQSTKKKGAGRGQTETAKRGRADEGRDSPDKRGGLAGEDGGGEMELEEADCTSSGVAHNSADRRKQRLRLRLRVSPMNN